MDGFNHQGMRDANGRFVAGHSGNPAGKKPGTRNRATVLREALGDGEDTALARIVIDRALAGDAVAARFLVDRLSPRPRDRAIVLDLPEAAGAVDLVGAYDETVRAMAGGEITPEEALTVTRVLDGRLRALKARAREERGRDAARSGPPPRSSGKTAGTALRRAPAEHSARPEPAEEPGGRNALVPSSIGDFRARLLHSACILQPPGWSLGTAA